MTRSFKAICAAICIGGLGFVAPVLADPYDDAVAAQEHGDHAEAARLLQSLAEQGDAHAQARLGNVYQSTGDYERAAEWYQRAADQGHSMAQLFLSILYISGRGVPQDYVLAHMWANLAASRMPPSVKEGYDEAIKRRNALATRMTPAQIAEAQRLAREWKPTR
jgi:uncharacterized protein